MHKDICHAPARQQVEVKIFFGLACPSGDMVQLGELETFLREEVTHIFPGFSVSHVRGFWKGQPEPAAIVTILSDDTGPMRQNVRVIAERYKTRFEQEAVAYSFTACEYTLNCWPFGPVGAYHREGKGY